VSEALQIVDVEFHPLDRVQKFAYAGPAGPVVAPTPRGPLLGWVRAFTGPAQGHPECRPATPSDLKSHMQRKLFSSEVAVFAARKVAELELPILVQGAQSSLDGEYLVVYFSAEGRVDFRALVTALAQQYRKKIELHQLPGRERARHNGGLGRCGRECCCTVWLREFPAVSVRMAEEQGLSLQPEAITGVCGKLLCCLRYEYDTWLAQREHPQVGENVDTPEGVVQVLEVNPHARTLRVLHPQKGEIVIPLGRARSGQGCKSCEGGTVDPPM
jgi:cell fate regulator YaaT (PSP1 superfamily)